MKVSGSACFRVRKRQAVAGNRGGQGRPGRTLLGCRLSPRWDGPSLEGVSPGETRFGLHFGDYA